MAFSSIRWSEAVMEQLADAEEPPWTLVYEALLAFES